MMRGSPGAGHSGFTLPELVMVIVIMGILAVVAVPRFFDRGVYDEQGFFTAALSAVRYAQKLAMASGCDVQVTFTAGAYALDRRDVGCDRNDCTDCDFDTRVTLPGLGGASQGQAPPGVTIAPATALYFDKIGRPRDPVGDNLLAGNTDISVGSRQMRIASETGFIYKP